MDGLLETVRWAGVCERLDTTAFSNLPISRPDE